ncbi:hypothetical protein [Jiella marina]|uniref:hypothetical protein n=1 Tax=Jiella sp. LLJ827 TaxID=2917712 RepID=UPI002101BDFA|nr:hypothetical protein [Jiella sp. LLJ827]MCQ0989061.1 hypothetical protein [Jiella sp. LLJ827]
MSSIACFASKSVGERLLPRLTASALAAGLFAMPVQAASFDSAYTKLDLDRCHIENVSEEGGGADFLCPGYEGITVYLSEGDLRFDVDFGAKNRDFDTFSAFNEPGETIEWRLIDGEPFAAILRFHLDAGSVPPERAQVLGVYRIGRPGVPGCTVGYVDASANRDANTLARQLADEQAVDFVCGSDPARFLGQVGNLAAGATAVGR